MTVRRFMEKTRMEPESGCLVWTACRDRKGYGSFAIGNHRSERAHRWIYQTLVGEIPEGLQIDHLCRNRACVNIAHLELVTLRENVRRGEVGRVNRNKSHCPQGHEYGGANVYMTSNGTRQCRACKSARQKERVA